MRNLRSDKHFLKCKEEELLLMTDIHAVNNSPFYSLNKISLMNGLGNAHKGMCNFGKKRKVLSNTNNNLMISIWTLSSNKFEQCIMITKDQCLMTRQRWNTLDEIRCSNMRWGTYFQNWSGLHHTLLCLEHAIVLSRAGASRYAEYGECCKPQLLS